MGPVTQSDGHDEPRLVCELVPRFAAVVEDVAVRGEDPVRDPVVAHVLPDVLDRVQLRCLGRERYERAVVGDHKALGLMPARLVHQDKGMRARRHRLRDLGQVQGHARGGAAGEDETHAFPLSRTNRAEAVSRLGSLIFRRCGAGAAFGPAPRDLVLLAHPGLIREPDLCLIAVRRLLDFLYGRESPKSGNQHLALDMMGLPEDWSFGCLIDYSY